MGVLHFERGQAVKLHDPDFETHQSDGAPEEFSKYRALFPITAQNGVTYLNSSFMLPMSTIVKDAIDKFLDTWLHKPTAKPIWTKSAAQTKELLAEFLNVPVQSLAFTSDTTEALNLFQRGLTFSPGDNIAILDVEHPNSMYGWLALREQGLEVRRIPTGTDTFADASTFAPYVDDRTVAVSISSVMFHSGQLNDVKSLCRAFRTRGIHVLVDLTQHVGFAPVDLTDWDVSAAAFGCHKGLGSPAGLGVLYIHPDVIGKLKQTPAIVGAGATANLPDNLVADPHVRYHPTTQRYEHLNKSMISIAALEASLDLLHNTIGMVTVQTHLRRLGKELMLACEKLGIEIVGSEQVERRSPQSYVLKLLHPDWATHFREDNIHISHYRCGARVSFGIYNNISDVQVLIQSLERGLALGFSTH